MKNKDTAKQEMIDFYLSDIIRKNLTIRKCILDESNSNDEDLDKTRTHFEQLIASREAV